MRKTIVLVLFVILVAFGAYVGNEVMKRNAAVSELDKANADMQQRTDAVNDFIAQENQKEDPNAKPYVELSAKYGNSNLGETEVESKNGMIVVPSGAALKFFWRSIGTQSCAMSPPLRVPSAASIGTNNNGQTFPIEKGVAYTITCQLKESGSVTDTLEIRVK